MEFSRIIGNDANLFACKVFSSLGLVDKLVDQISQAGILPRFTDLATLRLAPQTYEINNKNNVLHRFAGGEAGCSLLP